MNGDEMAEANKYWAREPETQNDANRSAPLRLRDPDDYYKISLRWDGCCELSVASNVPFADFDENHQPKEGSPQGAWIDNLHICDLRKFIERLQDALEKACDHFGDDGEWEGQRAQ